MQRGAKVTVTKEMIADNIWKSMSAFQQFNEATVSKWSKVSQRVMIKWNGQDAMWFDRNQVKQIKDRIMTKQTIKVTMNKAGINTKLWNINRTSTGHFISLIGGGVSDNERLTMTGDQVNAKVKADLDAAKELGQLFENSKVNRGTVIV